jgi:uncharacterized membrane protein
MMSEPPRNLPFRLSGLKGRVTIALLVAIATHVLTFRLEIGLRIAMAYDFGVATYLVLLAYRINNISAEDLKNFYEDREPSGRLAILGVLLFSSLSMAGVGLMADISQNWPPIQAHMHTAFCLLAIVLSWILLHAFYAFYYGHLYYDVDERHPERPMRKGLNFPTDDLPDYWDFLYYSFAIAMCYQSPGVTIVSRTLRRVTLFHAILSFLYVTAILGLVINILSNEI